MYQSIRIEKQGSVWRVVLNRPEVRNAHDLDMFREIAQAFDEVENDPACRCAVLTGEGDFFCAGQDLRFTRHADAQAIDAYGRANVAARQRIQRNFKPVVAAVNGPAIGGGVYLATACDLIVSVDTAFSRCARSRRATTAAARFCSPWAERVPWRCRCWAGAFPLRRPRPGD